MIKHDPGAKNYIHVLTIKLRKGRKLNLSYLLFPSHACGFEKKKRWKDKKSVSTRGIIIGIGIAVRKVRVPM